MKTTTLQPYINLIKQERRRFGLSQEALAASVHMSVGAFRLFEQGKTRDFKILKLLEIFGELGISYTFKCTPHNEEYTHELNIKGEKE